MKTTYSNKTIKISNTSDIGLKKSEFIQAIYSNSNTHLES